MWLHLEKHTTNPAHESCVPLHFQISVSYFFLISVFWRAEQLQAVESHLRDAPQLGDISAEQNRHQLV